MEFRCKRYRISEVTGDVPRKLNVERVFVIECRWFGLSWVRQPIPPIYFYSEGVAFAGVQCLRGLTWVFYDIEDAVDGLATGYA